MEKIDCELKTVLEETDPDQPIRVILQACPKQQSMDKEAWAAWAKGTFMESAAKATGMHPSSFEIMPNLKTMVITAPGLMVKRWAEAPETKSIRLQPNDSQVEFFHPVRK